MKTRFHRLTVLTLFSLLLGACALSPQQITVAPELKPGDGSLGGGRKVVVTVQDEREEPVIGRRGGVYADSSEITVANNLTAAIAEAVRKKLRSMGFSPVEAYGIGTAEGMELRLIVDTLKYTHPDEASMGYDVELLSELRAQVSRANETFEGRYRVKKSRHFFNSPSARHNEELVNEVLSETLERAFADPRLLAFLTK